MEMGELLNFEMKSLLNVSREKLWSDIWDFENVNKELAPFIRMTLPDTLLSQMNIKKIPLNEKLFTSYILLLKFIPIDAHYFSIKNIVEFERFDETSASMMMRQWCHSRILESQGEQTLLTDRVGFEHKIPFVGKLTFPIYKKIFQNRHKYLKSKYNH